MASRSTLHQAGDVDHRLASHQVGDSTAGHGHHGPNALTDEDLACQRSESGSNIKRNTVDLEDLLVPTHDPNYTLSMHSYYQCNI